MTWSDGNLKASFEIPFPQLSPGMINVFGKLTMIYRRLACFYRDQPIRFVMPEQRASSFFLTLLRPPKQAAEAQTA